MAMKVNFVQLLIVQIVDTPGFDGEDDIHMEEMMDTLANVLGQADTLVLVLKGDTERFTQSLHDMLVKMALIFGSGVTTRTPLTGECATLNTPNIARTKTGSRTTSMT